ncbi:hypothetical protein [Streptomyces aureus]|uniref:Uncharacterized protein n=1 Tax=Streptomyces aureus TaxID=193461 RepID=A0ABV4SSG3_9ACTN
MVFGSRTTTGSTFRVLSFQSGLVIHCADQSCGFVSPVSKAAVSLQRDGRFVVFDHTVTRQ